MSSDASIKDHRMATLAGLATSRGFVSGPVFLNVGDRDLAVPEYEVPAEKAAAEFNRYHVARDETRRQIKALAEHVGEISTEANIFDNHLAILDDALIVDQVIKAIREDHINAEAAIHRVVGRFREMFGQMDDPYLRERIRDLDDIERRILRILLGCEETALSAITSPVVIVADDLTPSETVMLPRELVLGIATDRGSATSHVALLARALGIPAVVGLGDVTRRVRPGDMVLLDGSNGSITVNPDAETIADFERLTRREKELQALVDEDKQKPGAMKDGTPLKIVANIQPGVPFASLAAFGAQGVGLYRTEYLWLGSDHEPTEEEQFEAYAEAVKAALPVMGPEARITFRCLDLGGDKLMRGVKTIEANPFLGNRSVRWLLSHRSVFRTQLRAILRASAFGKAAIMFPMIATLAELRECNRELEQVKTALRAEGLAFDEHIMRGAMVETPAAALCADQLAREVDFFSMGTNDLVQYTLAADRGNEQVAYLSHASDPSVIRLVEMTCRLSREGGIYTCVCGESASDPVLAVLWVGLGVKVLSMSPSCVPVIKKVLRGVTLAEAKILAAEVLAACSTDTALELYDRCRRFLLEKVPDFETIQTFFTAN
ncbi:MAG: phosphoenolpyruvate--protein phosphotransferase [Kiritimatiellae bacterium]|nr:phosphoenolpyruvate--protein phosphotransferase [Kiritimatiellia bacterium]